MPSRERAAFLLRDQARYCEAMGSPLYAHLLERAAEDAGAGGPVYELLEPFDAPSLRADALALRLMAAVHRLVLGGQAPGLAAHYPSAGGSAALDGAWPAFRDVVADRREHLRSLVVLPCQTNEVGRCAALAFGFLEVAQRYRRPLRLLEVGASAGLSLRFDRFRYAGGGACFGPERSPVDLSGLWVEAPPHLPAEVQVVERRGCDLRPVNPTSPDGRLTLESSVWADQVDRMRRLRGAFEVAAREPARVDAMSVERWLPQRLAERRPGVATVVFHSIVDEYLRPAVRAAFHAAMQTAGAQASPDAPLAWVRLEPTPATRGYAVTLTTWPGSEERVVATSGAHGNAVRRGPGSGNDRDGGRKETAMDVRRNQGTRQTRSGSFVRPHRRSHK